MVGAQYQAANHLTRTHPVVVCCMIIHITIRHLADTTPKVMFYGTASNQDIILQHQQVAVLMHIMAKLFNVQQVHIVLAKVK